MSERRDADLGEALSVFLDGEVDRDAARFLIRRLECDPEARARLGRMALIGACLRREIAAGVSPSLADRVAAALAAEERRAHRRGVAWWRLSAGFSAAATVAAVALLAGGPEPPREPFLAGRAAPAPALAPASRPERAAPNAAPVPFAELRTVSWTPGEGRPQNAWPLVLEAPDYLRLLRGDPPAAPAGREPVSVRFARPLPAETTVEPAPRR